MKKKLLSIVSMLLVVCTLFSTLAGCHKHQFERIVKEELKVADATYEHANIYKKSCECGEVSDETFQSGSLLKYEVGSKADMLDGKKILMVGCSYTYYGNVVIKNNNTDCNIEERSNDPGYFYQFCKLQGADVNVVDWCYGSHGYRNLFSEKCERAGACKGRNHLADLTDKNYDYVVLQDIGWGSKYPGDEEYVEYVKNILKIFKDANPNVKFLFSFQPAIIFQADNESKGYFWGDMIKPLEEEGLIVVDWGTLIYDIWTGAVKVPNSKYTYNKQSFIVSNDTTDGYHQNMLAGYLTALMLYCTITGETAVGQPFEFASDRDVHAMFNTVAYKYEHYKYIKETNFDVIMKDAEEMRNIQILVDQYVRTQQYTKYFN